MPRVPRGVALVSAAAVIARSGGVQRRWMYYTSVDPQARLGVTPLHRARTADLLLTAVVPGTPAARAGLQPGDRIVEINGRRLDTPNPFFDAVTRGRPGDAITLRVERGPDHSFTANASLEPRLPEPAQPRVQVVVGWLLRFYPAAFLIVAAVVLLQRPRDRTAWLLALLFISLIAAAPIDEDELHPALRRFALSFKMLGGLMPALVYCFFAVFPSRSPIERRAPWVKYVLLVPNVVVVGVLMVIVGRAQSFTPLQRIVESSASQVLVPLLILYWCVSIALGLVSLVLNDLRAPDAESRRRTRVIVWAMLVGLTPISVLHTVAAVRRVDPYSGFPFWIWAPSVLLLFLIPVSFAYAVVRYRVLEIPVLLKRSARYLLVQRGFVVLLFLLSVGATVAVAIELPLPAPGPRERARAARPRRGRGTRRRARVGCGAGPSPVHGAHRPRVFPERLRCPPGPGAPGRPRGSCRGS